MLIFALDDEPLMLRALCEAIREAAPEADIRAFPYAAPALDAIEKDGLRPDAVFTDIEMPVMTGLELSTRIRALIPETNIIFITGFSQYSMEAYSVRPSGYLIKPVDPESIRTELQHLRYPVQQTQKCRVYARCFGNFEVFAEEKPIPFRYTKTKELFAYLVDRRGAVVNTAELCAVLWENAKDSESLRSNLRHLLSDLVKTLAHCNADSILLKSRNRFAVDMTAFDCDAYAFLNGDPAARAAFAGEYMHQYSWAEPSLAGFLSHVEKSE